ncbi:Xaa-Pro peptidase family protein [soil metagenome]
MDTSDRRRRISARVAELDLDGLLVTRLPNVRYLTGFTGSNAQLLLTRTDSVFLTDGRYAQQSMRQVPAVSRRIYTGEFPTVFHEVCAGLGVNRVAFESAGVTHKTFTDISSPGIELIPTTNEVELLRWVKDDEERGHLRAAQSIADDVFDLIVGKLAEGMSEAEVGFEIDLASRRAGATGPAFDTIVAFGENAAEPHHRPGDRPLGRGDIVKLDFGCVVEGYHSDMTRTVAFGNPPPRLRDVYEVVRAAQQAGVEAVSAGVTGAEADRAARDVIGEAGFAQSYRHSLGHGVGLEVHEGPSLRPGGEDVLPEGAVVTVEPGIYLEGIGGVRIEDMVEVEGNGARVLPRATKELLVL